MPLYLENLDRLREVSQELESYYESCRLCPRNCAVNRFREYGFCKAPAEVVVSSYGPHFGEEPPLVGSSGSGTIFFTYCNLLCVFCQNYEISHLGYGNVVSEEELAGMMLYLQRLGCHNVNLVTPTHYVPSIIKALYIAAKKGLKIPVVYNCGGYESLEVIGRLRGLIDIYMPDIKFFDEEACKSYLNTPDYSEVVKKVVKEMFDQVGNLEIVNGIAVKGLLIRHLVMPDYVEDSKRILEFVASEISKNAYVNIMFQYRPLYKAREYKRIARRPYDWEYREVVKYAHKLGLWRGFGGKETV